MFRNPTVTVNENDGYQRQLLDIIGQLLDCRDELLAHPNPLPLKMNGDLGCDSLQVAEIVILVEETFDIRIDNTELEKITHKDSSLKDVYQLVMIGLCETCA